MTEKRIHTVAGNRWRANLRRADGSLPARVSSADVERAFWARRMMNPPPPDPYAKPIYDRLVLLAQKETVQSVLEIGPGWGNYTFPLCCDFSQVCCVDLSADNLKYLSAQMRRANQTLHTLCGAWEDVSLDVCGNPDMIFAYNCFYRLSEPEHFLRKMDRFARRLCVIGMNCPPELPWLPKLEEAGLPVHYTNQGCMELQEILASIGIRAELLNIPNERMYRYCDEHALLERANSFLSVPVPREVLLPLLRPFHTLQADGSLLCRHTFSGQLLSWLPAQS